MTFRSPSKIGNNLNQIAKYVNFKKAIDRVVAKEIIKIKEALDNVSKIL